MTKDDQGGSVRQLGFLFLYELLTGGSTVNLCGRDCTASMASLLTRLFFMRHSTWGRTAQSTAHSSKQFATLAAIIDAPAGHTWPAIPEADLGQLGGGAGPPGGGEGGGGGGGGEEGGPPSSTEGLDVTTYQDGNSAFSQFLVAVQAEHARVRQAVTHEQLIRDRQQVETGMQLKRRQLSANMTVYVVGHDPTCVYPAASDASCNEFPVVPFAPKPCGAGVDGSEAVALAARETPFVNLFDGATLQKAGVEVSLSGKMIALYFGAGWCKPCQTFTPLLKDFCEENESSDVPFEVVFVSLDKSAAEMQACVKKLDMPWAVVPFESPLREQLRLRYGVTQVPSLLVFDPDGRLKTKDAIRDVRTSPSKLKEWNQSAGHPEFDDVTAPEPEPELAAGAEECSNVGVELTADDVNAFATVPLHPLGLTTFVEREQKPVQMLDQLPFKMENHPEAQGASVSGEMLFRFQEDCKKYSEKVAKTTNYWFQQPDAILTCWGAELIVFSLPNVTSWLCVYSPRGWGGRKLCRRDAFHELARVPFG